jgi:hypothetical protein
MFVADKKLDARVLCFDKVVFADQSLGMLRCKARSGYES